MANLSTGLASEMSLPTVQQDTSPVKVVPGNNKNSALISYRSSTLVSAASLLPDTECVLTLISWTPTSLTA